MPEARVESVASGRDEASGKPGADEILAFLLLCVVVLEVVHLGFDIADSWSAWAAQLTLPFAVNSWSDGPLMVQIDRIARGDQPYHPVFMADSFTYGPAYLYVLAFVDRWFQAAPSIVPLRLISAAIGFAGCIPLLLSLEALRRERGKPWRVESLLPVAFTFVAYFLVIARDPTFIALHPNALAQLTILTGIACVLWYPLTRYKWPLLALLIMSCVVAALTKLNETPLLFFFLAALVIGKQLTLRLALITSGAYAILIALYYAVIPGPQRDWTFTIPAHHWYRDISFGVGTLFTEWVQHQPWQGTLFVCAVAVLVYQYNSGERTRALVYGTMLLGLFLTGFTAMLKVGGGAYDLWWVYTACLIPLGAFLETVIEQTDGAWRKRLVLQGAAALYLIWLPWAFMQGWHWSFALLPDQEAQLAQTGQAVAKLCGARPRIMVTVFPDPLLRCPGTTFQFWDSVEEVTWARPRGYDEPIVMDKSVSPDAFVMFRELWFDKGQPKSVFPFKLRGSYQKVTLPFYQPINFGATTLHLDLYLKKSAVVRKPVCRRESTNVGCFRRDSTIRIRDSRTF